MALTAYCKKCNAEVDPGEVCPRCGAKLGKNAAHAAWCLERVPVRDWMSWNAVMRVLLPAGLAILLLAFLLEALSGGAEAAERMLRSDFLAVVGLMLALVLLGVGILLFLRGRELADYVVDSRGVHETRYLPDPTPLKLLARFRSPGLIPEEGEVLKLGEREIAWKDVARVQLWPEKCVVLFYAPAWWMRVPVVCTPFNWEDVMGLIREKLGKKKKVSLPPALRVSVPPARRSARPQAPRRVPALEDAIEQIRMEELAEGAGESLDLPDAFPADPPPDSGPGTPEEDGSV